MMVWEFERVGGMTGWECVGKREKVRDWEAGGGFKGNSVSMDAQSFCNSSTFCLYGHCVDQKDGDSDGLPTGSPSQALTCYTYSLVQVRKSS